MKQSINLLGKASGEIKLITPKILADISLSLYSILMLSQDDYCEGIFDWLSVQDIKTVQ